MHDPQLNVPFDLVPNVAIQGPIASGGQKHVFKGIHDSHGDVVVKLVRLGTEGEDPRIKREVEILSNHSFTRVPRVYSSGPIIHDTQNYTYIVEEQIPGSPLRALMVDSGRQTMDFVLTFLFSILESLAEVAAASLVHRDIKPENIIVGDDYEFWLIDFGIARHLDMSSLTATEAAFGPATLGYAAPEQLRNLKAQIDGRADLYSVGVVAYELLSGSNPFIAGVANPLDVIRRTISYSPPILSIDGDSNKKLAAYINLLCAGRVSRRPRDAEQAAQWLSIIMSDLQ